MYQITRPKPTWQLMAMVADGGSPRPLCVRVEPECVALKQKGRRTWYRLPWKVAYLMAARATAEAKRKEKQAARERRRSIRRGALA